MKPVQGSPADPGWIGIQTQILGNDPIEQVQQLGKRR